MKLDNKIKINLLFDQFPLTNQMYINEMVHKLGKESSIDLSITNFGVQSNKSSLNIFNTLSYVYRKIYEKYMHFINPKYKTLSYTEIKWLKNKIDIVHIHHSYLMSKTSNIIKLNIENRPKIIVTLRGSDTYVKPWYYRNWKAYYNEIAPKIDAFIVQSEHQKKYLHKWGVNLNLVHVIPSSIKKPLNTHKNKSSSCIKITSSFRMCWEKNIDCNIRVIKHLVDLGYNVEYNIYGYGNDLGQVYYLIDHYNLSHVVNVKGKVENDTYLSQLLENDFYLQLSIVESLSVSVIEAQANGLPAIVSNSSGIKETIAESQSGFAVEYHDVKLAAEKIIELFKDEVTYVKFSKAAIAHANSKFINEIEVENQLQLYNELLAI